MRLYLISAATIILNIIYDLVFLPYYKVLFPFRKHAKTAIIISLFINTVLVMALYFLVSKVNRFLQPALLCYFVTLTSSFFQFKAMYDIDSLSALYAAGQFSDCYYLPLGIIISALSLILRMNMGELLSDIIRYMTILAISIVIALSIFFILSRTVVHSDKSGVLVKNKRELFYVTILQIVIVLIGFLIYSGNVYTDDGNVLWIGITLLIFCVALFSLFLYIYNSAAKASHLTQYEAQSHFLKEQLDRQILHYKSYQKYTESFRAFRHDYKNMMTAVASLICEDRECKAGNVLKSLYDKMEATVSTHKNYSNNVMIDAIMQDAANRCGDEGIRFSAVVLIPENKILDDLDVVRIFTNTIDNALEACRNIEDPSERFVEIKTDVNQDWIIINASNSFNGEIKMRDGKIQTIKQNEDYHGIGLSIISEGINGLGGFVKINPDTEKKVFTLTLLIPI